MVADPKVLAKLNAALPKDVKSLLKGSMQTASVGDVAAPSQVAANVPELLVEARSSGSFTA